MFAAGLWVSGDVNGAPRFAGATYSNWEFWPGPLDANAETISGRCASFDKIWRVSFGDLRDYTEYGYQPGTNPDLLFWPIAHGAPYFLDTNGNDRRDESEPRLSIELGDPGYSVERGSGIVIDLNAGYRPDLVGDQAAWWVMNDNGNSHAWSGSQPLGIEVQVLAYAFSTSDTAISQATVYEYTLHNRSPHDIEDSRISFWTDPDLGNFDDDYVTSDASRSLAIAYNGDENDEGAAGYGVPPAIGIDLLSGGASAFTFENTSGPTGDPAATEDRTEAGRRIQESQWKDGTPLTRGGIGYNPGDTDVTSWTFDGDPLVFGYWTEEQPVPNGAARDEADRRLLITTPAETLMSGASRRVDIALLFAVGAADRTRLESLSRVRDISDAVQAAYDADGTTAIREVEVAYTAAPSPPSGVPALTAPEDGVDYDATTPAAVTFSWTAVAGADAYALQLGAGDIVLQEYTTSQTSLTLSTDRLPADLPTTRWRVTPLNWGGAGPTSDTRTYDYLIYRPGVLYLSDGRAAFVEVVGPGGADPCGTDANSTVGCIEVGGNGIANSYNGTRDYVGGAVNEGSEATLPAFAPTDYEIRFTEGGSYAYYQFTTGKAIWVPFEVWDIGITKPFQENDPSDDVQLIVNLFADGAYSGGTVDECVFGYVAQSVFGLGPVTQRIYGYYPTTTYSAWETAIEPLINADPNGCPSDPATASAAELIDIDRGRPIQRFILEQTSSVDVDGLTGTVIRFYTNDPRAVAADEGPEARAIGLSVHPNPATAIATVPYALAEAGPVRLRVVDVLGREVAVLADGPHAAGTHEETLDTTPLAAGVYVLVLDTDGQRVSRTVTVAR